MDLRPRKTRTAGLNRVSGAGRPIDIRSGHDTRPLLCDLCGRREEKRPSEKKKVNNIRSITTAGRRDRLSVVILGDAVVRERNADGNGKKKIRHTRRHNGNRHHAGAVYTSSWTVAVIGVTTNGVPTRRRWRVYFTVVSLWCVGVCAGTVWRPRERAKKSYCRPQPSHYFRIRPDTRLVTTPDGERCRSIFISVAEIRVQ